MTPPDTPLARAGRGGVTVRPTRKARQHLRELVEAQAEARAILARRHVRRLRESAALDLDWVGPWAALLQQRTDDPSWMPVGSSSNRRHGTNFPFYQNEQQLMLLRDLSRIVVGTNTNAWGLLRGYVAFVIGTGFKTKVSARDGNESARKRVVHFLDEWARRNNWAERQQELARRTDRDGDGILRLFPDDGYLKVRFVWPEQVTQPPGESFEEWSFGIKWATLDGREDCETVEAVYVADLNAPTSEGDVVDGDEIVLFQPENDSGVKRRLPLFSYGMREVLDTAGRLTRNLGEGAAVREAIAYMRKQQTAEGSEVEAANFAEADFRERKVERDAYIPVSVSWPGMVVDFPDGTEPVPPPANAGTAADSAVVDLLVRSACARINAPEWLGSSNAANMGAYTSSLVAESPFVVGVKQVQSYYRERFMRVVRKALEVAVAHGLLERDDVEAVTVELVPPSPEARDKDKEAGRAKTEIDLGVQSRQAYMESQDRDAERIERDNKEWQQRNQRNQPPQQPGPGGPSPVGGPGGPGPGGPSPGAGETGGAGGDDPFAGLTEDLLESEGTGTWVAHVITKGKRKGQTAFLNPTTGELRDHPPGQAPAREKGGPNAVQRAAAAVAAVAAHPVGKAVGAVVGPAAHEAVAAAKATFAAAGKAVAVGKRAFAAASLLLDRLPGGKAVKAVGRGAVKVFTAVMHPLEAAMRGTQRICKQAAYERGYGDRYADALGRVLYAADFVGGYAAAVPAHVVGDAVAGPVAGATAANVAGLMPTASLLYLAWSTAVDPVATFHAADRVVRAKVAKTKAQAAAVGGAVAKGAKAAVGALDKVGDAVAGSRLAMESEGDPRQESLERLADATDAADDPDWFQAVVMAGLGHGLSLEEAIRTAEESSASPAPGERQESEEGGRAVPPELLIAMLAAADKGDWQTVDALADMTPEEVEHVAGGHQLSESVERSLLEAGFTGTITDKAGRKRHYVDGKQVANPDRPAPDPHRVKRDVIAEAKKAKAEREPGRQTARTVWKAAVQDPSRVTGERLKGLAAHLRALTRDELRETARALRQKVGGLKEDLVKRLLDHVKEKGDRATAGRPDRKTTGQYGAWGRPPEQLVSPPPPPAPARDPNKPPPGWEGRRWNAATSTLAESIAAHPTLTPEQKKAYTAAAQAATKRMPPKALEHIAKSLKTVKFHPSLKDMVKELTLDVTEGMVNRQEVAVQFATKFALARGAYRQSSGTAYLDGEGGGGEGTYAHELTHAIDHGYQFSGSDEWKKAFAEEIDRDGPMGGALSAYARTKPSEGFAEFGRVVYTFGTADRARLERAFPQASAFFKRNGLWPSQG